MPSPLGFLKLDTSSDLMGQLSECHGGPVTSCAFGPRLTWAVSGGWDGHLLRWDPTTSQSSERWVASKRPIAAVAVSPDGSKIYVGDMDGKLTTWNGLTKLQESEQQVHTRPIGGIAVAGHGRAYATAGWDGVVQVWSRADDEEPWKQIPLRGHQDMVAGCKFWPDGRWLLSWSHDGTAKLWDIQHGYCYQTWPVGQRAVAADIAADASMFAVGTAEGQVFVWNLQDSHHPPFRWEDNRPIKAVYFSPNAQELIVVNDKGIIQFLNVPQFYPTCPAVAAGFAPQAVGLPPTAECLALGGEDGSLLFRPLPHLERCEVILTPMERFEEHSPEGLWGKMTKRTTLLRTRRASCPKCGRLLELTGEAISPPRPCPGCSRQLAFTPFSLAG